MIKFNSVNMKTYGRCDYCDKIPIEIKNCYDPRLNKFFDYCLLCIYLHEGIEIWDNKKIMKHLEGEKT